MASPEETIEALKIEREGYARFDRKDRVAEVDKQIAHWESVAGGEKAPRAQSKPKRTTQDSAPKQTR